MTFVIRKDICVARSISAVRKEK